MERKRKKTINSLQYWHDLSDCECNSKSPIGGCLKCDLANAIAHEDKLVAERDKLYYYGVKQRTRLDRVLRIAEDLREERDECIQTTQNINVGKVDK